LNSATNRHGLRRTLLTLAFLALAVAALAPPAAAVPIVSLTFDELQPGEDVLSFYAGGFGSLASGPGPNYGVTFSPGVISESLGNVSPNEASFQQGAILDLATPFTGLFSFYHMGDAGSVHFFSGPNGTGSLVSTLAVPSSAGFFPVSDLLPLFRSAVWEVPGSIDTVTFGASVVPEPPVVVSLGIGLGALALAMMILSPMRRVIAWLG
jgi:hypothetical protein